MEDKFNIENHDYMWMISSISEKNISLKREKINNWG